MILKKDKINELLEKIIFFYNTPFDNLIIFFLKSNHIIPTINPNTERIKKNVGRFPIGIILSNLVGLLSGNADANKLSNIEPILKVT